MNILKSGAVAALMSGLLGTGAQAASIAPDIIFGSGNDNGSFTVADVSSPLGTIEIGLRGKLRYDDAGQPQNVFNWDDVDTYSFANLGATPSNRSVFNFEWHVNTTGTGRTIAQLIALGASSLIEFDVDPTAGTDFVAYNPFDFDAYYGTNATGNGGGTYSTTGPISGATVAQNSVNYGFLTGAPLGRGIYDVKYSVFSPSNTLIGSNSITISTVPIPAALPLLMAALGGLGLAARRRKAAAA